MNEGARVTVPASTCTSAHTCKNSGFLSFMITRHRHYQGPTQDQFEVHTPEQFGVTMKSGNCRTVESGGMTSLLMLGSNGPLKRSLSSPQG